MSLFFFSPAEGNDGPLYSNFDFQQSMRQINKSPLKRTIGLSRPRNFYIAQFEYSADAAGVYRELLKNDFTLLAHLY